MMNLLWYQWIALGALGICLTTCFAHFIRLLNLGRPKDLSQHKGKTGGGIRYAFTGAMSPARKESAYLHLPTYTAGLIYHTGTFISLALFFFIIAGWMPSRWIAAGTVALLGVSALCGIGILVKRIVRIELRSLSNPDDYISNLLVTLFQISTIIILFPSYSPIVLQSYSPIVLPSSRLPFLPSYYLLFAVLMLYIPIGKLRHVVYFFAARYHLGFFFGWRGIWPPREVKSKFYGEDD